MNPSIEYWLNDWRSYAPAFVECVEECVDIYQVRKRTCVPSRRWDGLAHLGDNQICLLNYLFSGKLYVTELLDYMCASFS